MTVKAKIPFRTLAVRYEGGCSRTSIFSIDDDLGRWVDPCYDTLKWCEFLVYGVPETETAMDDDYEDDLATSTRIGRIHGCHIAKSLIVNIGEDPYVICDDAHGDLEAMYSVLKEYEEKDKILEDLAFEDDIFYIGEIELEPEYQGVGYEKKLLLQLPAIIVRSLHVFPGLMMYYSAPTQHREPEIDEEAQAILAHRLEYNSSYGSRKGVEDSNVTLFPPMREVPEKEINRVLGRRNPGDIVPEAYRNRDIHDLYESVGFKELGQTGWLCKRIASIFTEDGLNH